MTEVDHLPRLSPGVTAGGARPVNNAGNPGGSPEAARKALNKDTIWRCIGHSSSVGAKPLKR